MDLILAFSVGTCGGDLTFGFTSLWPDGEETDIYEASVCAQDCARSFPYVISPSPPESDKVCGV